MTVLKSLLHSLAGTFAGGHFHWTFGLTILIVVVLALTTISRSFNRSYGTESSVVVTGSGGGIAAAAVISGILWYLATHKTKAAAPVVEKTTIVQHVASHPAFPAWAIVAIAIAALVVGLVMFLNLKNRD